MPRRSGEYRADFSLTASFVLLPDQQCVDSDRPTQVEAEFKRDKEHLSRFAPTVGEAVLMMSSSPQRLWQIDASA
jgi:hypothetical protein